MVKKFSREISGTQSQYKATIERKYVTQQCSYNLPIELEEHLKSLGAIEKVNPSSRDTNATYKLANGYKMRLGPNIIAAIGDSYKSVANEVVFTHTEGENGTSKKIQLKKTDFKAQASDNYKWFVDLYEKNIEGTVLTITVDDEKKTVGFNLELTPFFFSGQSLLAEDETVCNENSEIKSGENVILYGVPGSGKSHTIKRDYCNDDNYMERVVFHPDYSYSDFIGQILPEVDELGKISYKFKAGPFTRILKRAENDKANNYYLVVEEINRGNAPAIFGDIFQLLDRKNGESEYGITNADIAREAYEDPARKVKIPSNLFILATMNTSDQNVFTLDTAFKRRWHMKMIENKLEDCKFADAFICGTPITWYSFAKTINKKIVEANKNNLSSEDNRLGAYFVDEADLYDVDLFSEKVLMYLWNDAFKFDRSDIFKAQYETLEELINGFKKQQFEIFSESVVFETAQLPEATNSNVEAYLVGKDPEKIALYNQFIEKITNKMSGLNIMTTSTLVYIAIKKDNNNLAEVYIKKNAIKVVTLMPEREELQIGRKLPESYRWTKDYEIILTESNIDVVVDAILEANKLI